MAGDWIKMRTGLATAPKVVRMAYALNADRLRVVGALHAVWSLADEHSEDGKLEGYTLETLDAALGWPGFGKAMSEAGWIEQRAHGLVFPRFEDHNGKTAKRRAMEAARQRRIRTASA